MLRVKGLPSGYKDEAVDGKIQLELIYERGLTQEWYFQVHTR